MYTHFYGLREKPFSLSPDPRYLFLSESHREALAHLLYGIEQGEGFIAITGEVGTGKTTLCRTLLERIEPGTEIAFIFNPQLSGLELLQAIAAELGLETEGQSRRELTEQLNRFLLAKRREGRRVLLLIDEVQAFERDALEQVRLLSNLETNTFKLLQIVLIGQPEFDAMLEAPDLRQLRQRIAVRWRLAPLDVGETREYVRHRLKVAAGRPCDLFSELAVREIHRHSRGIPRLINLLCDRALLAGYAAGTHEIGLGLVTQVEREISGRPARPPRSARDDTKLRMRLRRLLAPMLAGFSVTLAAALAAYLIAPELFGAAPPQLPETMQPPVAAPPPASLPAVASAPPAAAAFSSVLSRVSPAETSARSLASLLRAWGKPAGGAELLSPAQAEAALRAQGFTLLSLSATTLDQLVAFDRPALLLLYGLDGAPRATLLQGIRGAGVTLSGVGANTTEIPIDELARHWRGEATVVWLDHAALPDHLSVGMSGDSVRWLQQSLAQLGYFEGPITGEYGADTQRAVSSFQAGVALPSDGRVDALTKLRLYERLPGYAAPPRLVTPASGAQS